MKWISIEESLPSEGENVIVYYSNVNGSGDVRHYVTLASRISSWSVAGDEDDGLSYWDLELTGIDNRILFWMRLPPIPNKEDL